VKFQYREDQEKSGAQDDQDGSIGPPKHSPAMYPVKPENLQGQEQDAGKEKALPRNLRRNLLQKSGFIPFSVHNLRRAKD